METNKRPENPRENIALDALECLSEAETQRLMSWPAMDNRSGQEAVTGMDQIVALLGYTAPPLTPPPSLKSRLLARLKSG